MKFTYNCLWCNIKQAIKVADIKHIDEKVN